ncbi:hypothetical protein CEXT_649651 [Caerostris extrusa]|uniref:Uncharacterized protein n=1 Tax=Caerostris extrusa TaxID=172846 RepID=A0AAV4T9W4_CAEEX|nr:hypothetical protein CEXT_649651 [Caerostris extrusa]
MQQPPSDRVRDDIISLYQSKDMRDVMNFTSFMIHLSRIFHSLRKPEVLEISKDASIELKLCLDRMFPKGVEFLKEQLYKVPFHVNQDLIEWKFLQNLAMEDPDSVLQKRLKIEHCECCTRWPSTNGYTNLKMFTIYDWEQLGELVLDYIYGYAWTDKLLKQHPTCPICLQPMWTPKKLLVIINFTKVAFADGWKLDTTHVPCEKSDYISHVDAPLHVSTEWCLEMDRFENGMLPLIETKRNRMKLKDTIQCYTVDL